jgi:hypothetical protein
VQLYKKWLWPGSRARLRVIIRDQTTATKWNFKARPEMGFPGDESEERRGKDQATEPGVCHEVAQALRGMYRRSD